MNMVEHWREPMARDEPGGWVEEETALAPLPRPGPAWPPVAAGLTALLMAGWVAFALYGFATDPLPPRDAATLTLRVALACVPLVLGAVLLLLIRQSDAAARRRTAGGERLALDSVRRLDEARGRFAAVLASDRQAADAQAQGWRDLADALTERTADLSQRLSDDLLALDGRLERVDAAAAGARRDLAAVLAGLPKVERQTRELVGGLREAGLTAHEGAGALDAQLGLLRHRAAEADEVAAAATARLAAQLERMDSIGQATAAQLAGAAADAAGAHDALMDRATLALDRSAAALGERTTDMAETVENAERRLGELADRSGAQLSAQLDLLDERTRGSRDVVAGTQDALGDVLRALDNRLAELGDRIAGVAADGSAAVAALSSGMGRLDETAGGLAARVEAGGEAMTFAVGRAESLLTALDAASRELDETLPASFGRFERSAGEGFQRLSESMPALERYHQLTTDASGQLSGVDERLGRLNAALDDRLSATDEVVSALAERVGSLTAALASAGEEGAPRLLGTLRDAHELAATLGDTAVQIIDEAVPAARQRLVEAVSQPVADAIEARTRDSAERAASVAADAVQTVDDAVYRLDEALGQVESTSRAVAERSHSVLALAAGGDEASFGRRVALLIEALNSTAVDVGKVLSNDVSDTAWAAYLKGDRAVFTRRAVRLLTTGEAREVLRAYEDDGEFRDQVNRYVHDFEALLRTVLADANGSVLAVTLLSSDTGKLYVALAQAIERLRV